MVKVVYAWAYTTKFSYVCMHQLEGSFMIHVVKLVLLCHVIGMADHKPDLCLLHARGKFSETVQVPCTAKGEQKNTASYI